MEDPLRFMARSPSACELSDDHTPDGPDWHLFVSSRYPGSQVEQFMVTKTQ
jgi:hypothetical protein